MLQHGFVRVAAACPRLRLADCFHNAEQILKTLAGAGSQGVNLVVFPELALTGYTCADLFQQTALQRAARQALLDLVRRGAEAYKGVAVVGVPLLVDDQLFNCAAVFHRGEVLGVVPKSFLPNYNEFYEARWFAPSSRNRRREIDLGGKSVPFGTEPIFRATDVEGFTIGVEICEDLWVPVPPSSGQALAGATVLVNLSASNEMIAKPGYRRQLVLGQSGRCIAAYVFASSGVHESTTDLVFSGHCMIAENSTMLAESARFERDGTLIVADVDLERLRSDRARMNSFGECMRDSGLSRTYTPVKFRLGQEPVAVAPNAVLPRTDLRRWVEAHPFVPRGQEQLRERCDEIFHMQVAGLARRLEQIGVPPVTIGVSGGLDSTLALLVVCKTMDLLGAERSRINALTMPGFGTTRRTRDNAVSLMRHLGVSAREVDIRGICIEEMRLLGHRPFGIDLEGLGVEEFTAKLRAVPEAQRHDLVFENVQARMRTSLLMNGGFVVGTGDVSELALGWCTYNGDHMSMYNPNASIPKTLVKFLVEWVARNEFDGEVRATLLDVVDTVISPELLPTGEGDTITQETESAVGPYELHDFFLFHFLRHGVSPEKLLFLAEHGKFHRPYSRDDLRRWLAVFLRRFFANQFKRSCLPDGPKVGSITLSPRGDWRMPSDAQAAVWLRWLDEEGAGE